MPLLGTFSPDAYMSGSYPLTCQGQYIISRKEHPQVSTSTLPSSTFVSVHTLCLLSWLGKVHIRLTPPFGYWIPALPKIIIPKCFSLLNQLYQITPISTGILLHLSDLLNSFPLVTTPFLSFPSQQNSLKPRSTFNRTSCDDLIVHICTAQQGSRSHRWLRKCSWCD